MGGVHPARFLEQSGFTYQEEPMTAIEVGESIGQQVATATDYYPSCGRLTRDIDGHGQCVVEWDADPELQAAGGRDYPDTVPIYE